MRIKSLVKKTLCILTISAICVSIPLQSLMSYAKEEQPVVSSQEVASSQINEELDSETNSLDSQELVDWLKLDELALSDEQFLELLATFRTAVIQIVNDYHDNKPNNGRICDVKWAALRKLQPTWMQKAFCQKLTLKATINKKLPYRVVFSC